MLVCNLKGNTLFLLLLATTVLIFPMIPGKTQADSAQDLAQAVQNPVASLITVPFQNNIGFGAGPDDDVINILNIQPVIPVKIGNWNIINRLIMPLIYLPETRIELPVQPGEQSEVLTFNSEFGVGDINYTSFLSPAQPGKVIWGIGPSFNFNTATDDHLGSGKWSAGPSVVILTQPSPWTIGVLARQLWSFAGDDGRSGVSQFLMQPFLAYQLGDGWALSSAPIMTSNWNADGGNGWTVPLGGGVNRVFTLGKQPLNASVQAYYNVERPKFAPEWTLRLQLNLLFPK
ncbi:hypothetical protein [Nitrosococcus watsonii]|uniref:Putative neuromedin U n=1 Tax=Nitrosococcus watsoni (strain C-113) TaxID=105559 RepID=D8K491_NITWC|nr:hypothetical protein [Nitrosococcus watsonii]ADJ27788.1 putative neuromedin U [Nitrosococcus watsonii C-113]